MNRVSSAVQPIVSNSTFEAVRLFMSIYESLNIPIISTTRTFKFYREALFDGLDESVLSRQLGGKVLVDIGCGLTPYSSDSMFQWCRRNEIDFYAVDPKLTQGFKLGLFDSFKSIASGAPAALDQNIGGMDKAIGSYSNNLDFGDNSVDIIVSCWLVFSWLRSEKAILDSFVEFDRVLKPGGEIRLYPTPFWDNLKKSYPSINSLLEKYTVEQRFKMNIKLLPFYSTTLTKAFV